jgi:outer membrane protein OmpA-like peptidoglycan-associated protein
MKKSTLHTLLVDFGLMSFCFLKACFVSAETADMKIDRPHATASSVDTSDPDLIRTFDRFTIYFDYNVTDLDSARGGNSPLSPTGKKVIADGFEALRHNYAMSGYKYDTRATDRIRIIGYSDHLGSAANNKRVALKRAKTVRDYVLSRGIDFSNGVSAKRISISFRISEKPIESRCSSMPYADEVRCLWLDRSAEIRYLRVDVEPHRRRRIVDQGK